MDTPCKWIAAFIAASTLFAAASPDDAMPPEQQNALVHKYCAVCHTDAARNGGLTLQHFNASHLDPSLAAMLVSKMKTGAIGAGGIPVPDKATTRSLIGALTSESAGSLQWTLNQSESLSTASILRDLPSRRNAGDSVLYRLVLSCDSATHQGEMQLSWSPSPKKGTLSISLDGKPAVTYRVDGDEKMGDGSEGTTGPASVFLETPLPLQTLTIANLFPNESVSFPFNELTQQARQNLAACFTPRARR